MCVRVCVVECGADMKFTTAGRRESYTVTRKRYAAHDYKVSCSRSHLCSLTCFRYLTCLIIVSKWCVTTASERLINTCLAGVDSKEAGIFVLCYLDFTVCFTSFCFCRDGINPVCGISFCCCTPRRVHVYRWNVWYPKVIRKLCELSSIDLTFNP